MHRRAFLGGIALGVLSLTPSHARADIERLRGIRARVEPKLAQLFAEHGLPYPPRRAFLRAFKREGVLELWAAATQDAPLVLVKAYPICAGSGTLGPKRREGDRQVPEGAYTIDLYNAWSAFHLSLRVDYPNASDRVRGLRGQLGGAIMVHGDCVTIGCIPIEDAPIEEVFVAVLDTHRAGKQHVPIHIFPTRMDDAGMELLARHGGAREHGGLWRELEPIYRAFEETHRVPKVVIDPRTGAYRLRRATS